MIKADTKITKNLNKHTETNMQILRSVHVCVHIVVVTDCRRQYSTEQTIIRAQMLPMGGDVKN